MWFVLNKNQVFAHFTQNKQFQSSCNFVFPVLKNLDSLNLLIHLGIFSVSLKYLDYT